jgi:hypothetical protein
MSLRVWYGIWYGAPPTGTPWAAIVATRWWQLDRVPTQHAQTEFVPTSVRACSEMGFLSTGQRL